MIQVGQRLTLSSWHPHKAWLNQAALAAVPAPAPALPVSAPAAAPAAVSQPASTSTATYSGGSGYQACVIAAESGGNASAVNPSSGAGGLYQFLPSTWAALGHSGLPQNASVAEQNQAYQQEYAQSGGAAWSPYDGC
jgi:soluble lytic murein transglycosylase-like protein